MCVTLTSGRADSLVTLNLTPMGGTATAGEDFSPGHIPVNITAYSGCVTASTQSDRINEVGVEMFMFVLASDDGRVTVDGDANKMTISVCMSCDYTPQCLCH